MPAYIYRCSQGHEQTVVHGMFEDPGISCTECGLAMKRKPSGGYWYRNPQESLFKYLDNGYRQYKERKHG